MLNHSPKSPINPMKNIILIAIAMTVALLFGCGKNEKTENNINTTIAYSNLRDKETQDFLKKAMLAAGINPQNADAFLESVKTFNSAVGEHGLVQSGFAKLGSVLPQYDDLTLQERWDAKHPEYAGFNCRITSFELLRDFITVKKPSKESPITLIFDEESIQNCGRTLFSDSELGHFRAIFAAVPTQYTKDLPTHLKNMQNYWGERGIRFTHGGDTNKASLISVVMHSAFSQKESYLFVGHAGVLVPFGGQLYFVEKLTFYLPYVVTRFNNRSELNDYLMKQYDVEWDQPSAAPFIMENASLLDGYRENPEKGKTGSN